MDARTLSLLLNTLYLAVGACGVALPLGILLGGVLWRTDFPGRFFLRTVLAAMLFVPLFLQTAAWQAGFGLQGWATEVFHISPLIAGWHGAIWIHAMAALPWIVLIVGIGLTRSERELEETALLDASPCKVFFRVTLKNALPAVGAAVLWTAVTAAGEMTVTDFFSIRTYAEELYTQLAVGQDPGVPPPSVLLGVVLTVVLIVAGVGLMNHLIPRERSLSVSPCLTFSLGRWRWPMVVLVGSFLLLLIGVPLASLVFKAGVKVEPSDDGIRRFFSPLKCLRMIGSAPKYFSREFFWSLVICSASATLSTLLATILAWWARIGPRREIPRKGLVSRLAKTIFNRRFAILMLLAIIFATPGPVFAFGVIRLLNRPEWPWLYDLYDHSILAPTLVLILKSLPAAALVMGYAMQSIPGEILENAAVDGAGSWRQFWHIALPMRWKAMAVAWIIALAVSLGDLASVVLVHPPGVFLLSTTIFNLMHYGVEDQVAGACMALILIFSGLAIAAIILFRRMVKSR